MMVAILSYLEMQGRNQFRSYIFSCGHEFYLTQSSYDLTIPLLECYSVLAVKA
jgi:hypothetical protein